MSRAPRPSDAEFDELKRKRDAALEQVIDELCAKHGFDRSKAIVHVSGGGPCYCACPDGPCQHIWDGPDFVDDGAVSGTCSRCGAIAMFHDMRCMP